MEGYFIMLVGGSFLNPWVIFWWKNCSQKRRCSELVRGLLTLETQKKKFLKILKLFYDVLSARYAQSPVRAEKFYFKTARVSAPALRPGDATPNHWARTTPGACNPQTLAHIDGETDAQKLYYSFGDGILHAHLRLKNLAKRFE